MCNIQNQTRDVPKITTTNISATDERLFLDIISCKTKGFGGSKFWVLLVDDYTDLC